MLILTIHNHSKIILHTYTKVIFLLSFVMHYDFHNHRQSSSECLKQRHITSGEFHCEEPSSTATAARKAPSFGPGKPIPQIPLLPEQQQREDDDESWKRYGASSTDLYLLNLVVCVCCCCFCLFVCKDFDIMIIIIYILSLSLYIYIYICMYVYVYVSVYIYIYYV